jgi:glyoxylase-like metal-dependent hydrolase (beta-lactamase superfamily II)/8-oxo-dGTP pyrophosphatase MutT (NUDIX family)
MPRPEAQLHPYREPAPLLSAATVLLMRDTPHGVEMLMTRRSLKASFAPGVYVFPGGGIDAHDHAAHAQSLRRTTQSEKQLTESLAAIRESWEEMGILLAHPADRALQAVNSGVISREGNDSARFYAQVQAAGLTLAGDEVFTLAHWITDREMPKRFDVPFLVARMPEGQQAVADESEQFEPVWVSPADALERHAQGGFKMIYPTIKTLERLRHYASVDDVLADCRGEQPLWSSCPRTGLMDGQEYRTMEHESAHGELELVTPDGQVLHPLDWQHHEPRPLLKNLARLTANNPHFMTGPGTNTYIVGTAATGYIVVDPGPWHEGDAETRDHIGRIATFTGRQIKAIVCTHSHSDHSPAAKPLQQLIEQQTGHKPLIYGLQSLPTARPGCEFTPDVQVADGHEFALSATGGLTTTLHTVHTPGHAANHVCLFMVEDGVLLSGDHILNGSTTVVDPPDGHMSDYLHSLDRLSQLCGELGANFIAPAHGYVLNNALEAIAHLKQHRLKREAKVVEAMKAKPNGDLKDWLPLAYDDVPERLWPVAMRSLTAHVERIRELEGA